MGKKKRFYITTFIHPREKKDSTHQIKVKIRIPKLNFQSDFPVEYLIEGKKNRLSLTKNEWNEISDYHKKIISKSEDKYADCIEYLLEKNEPINTKRIKELYDTNIFDFTKNSLAEKIRGLLAYGLKPETIDSYTDDELLEIVSNTELDQPTETVYAEDMDAFLLEAERKLNIKKELDKTSRIKDHLERCDRQYEIEGLFNKSKIIDVFGYFWKIKKVNGRRIMTRDETKVILRLAEYIFRTGASNHINSFNKSWIEHFFLYLRDFGYCSIRLKNYTPLELYGHKEYFIDANSQKPYSESSYKSILKKFKKYYRTLRDDTDLLNKLPFTNLENITFDSLVLADANYSDIYTQKDHYVSSNELIAMLNHRSEDDMTNLARDIFFIQTFTSGNRSIDKDRIEYGIHQGEQFVEVIHSKTKTSNIVGIFKPLGIILRRYNDEFPNLSMSVNDFNNHLKKLATELKLNRDIQFVENKMNSMESKFYYKPLNECISQYFSRHTLVNYLIDAGHSDDKVIEITGHVSTEILKHYKKRHDIKRKQKIIDEADSQFDWGE